MFEDSLQFGLDVSVVVIYRLVKHSLARSTELNTEKTHELRLLEGHKVINSKW